MTAATPIEVVRELARGSGLSILIKVANAGLAYLMLLVIARVSSGDDYGVFATAFSVGVSAAYVAALGQQRAVMRYWTQWTAQGQPGKARAVLRRSLIVCGAGLGFAGLVILVAGAMNLVVAMPWSFAVAAGTALIAMGFGWAEFSSSALRAQGHIVIAMAPRDIVWRVIVAGLFGAAALAGWSFSGGIVVLTVGAALMIVVFPQVMMLCRTVGGTATGCLAKEDRQTVSRYSVIMWASTTADLAKNYAGVVIVSSFFGAGAAGGYFAAERTANLLSFLLLAIVLVAGPQISRHFHSGRKDLVQIIVGLAGFIAGSAALVGLVFFIFFGDRVLTLFNPAYDAYLPVLLVLCLGQLFGAASGPVNMLLTLSGHERLSLILVVGTGITSVGLQVIGAEIWGLMGVAAGAAAGFIFISVFAVVFAAVRLGFDSTGLTLVVRYCRDHLYSTGRPDDRRG